MVKKIDDECKKVDDLSDKLCFEIMQFIQQCDDNFDDYGIPPIIKQYLKMMYTLGKESMMTKKAKIIPHVKPNKVHVPCKPTELELLHTIIRMNNEENEREQKARKSVKTDSKS